MFIEKLRNYANKFLLAKNITPKLDFTTNLYAIAIYLDKNIKQIELKKAKALIKKTIEKDVKDISDSTKNNLVDYYYYYLKQELHNLKEVPGYFELQKIKMENQIDYISISNLKEILEIINSDQIVTKEEREFYEKISSKIK